MSTPQSAPSRYRSKHSQKGEAELLTFGIVVLIAALISGTFWILGWIKQNKYIEREARRKAALAEKYKGPFKPRRDPAEYLAHCQKSGWLILKTDYPCEVKPESYGELFLMPE
jgi:hypothetical protein